MTAPKPDVLLSFMRDLLAKNTEQNAIIVLGSDVADADMLVPCDATPPGETLDLLCHARSRGLVPELTWVAIVSDTYTIRMQGKEADLDALPEPGDLGRAFKAGDSRVREALMAMCVSPDGPSYCVQQVYRRDHDEIEYDRIDTLPMHQVGGDLIAGARALLGMAAR